MKLGSLKGGRDGRLVVVSRDLAWCADAGHLAPTLQAALDDWERIAPQLELLATDLEHGIIPQGPLPRARSRRAAAARLSMGGRLGLCEPCRAGAEGARRRDARELLDRPAHVSGRLRRDARRRATRSRSPTKPGAATSRPRSSWSPTTCRAASRARRRSATSSWSAWSTTSRLRNLIPAELAKGFGFVQSKPASALSPVLVTPDELGEAWARRQAPRRAQGRSQRPAVRPRRRGRGHDLRFRHPRRPSRQDPQPRRRARSSARARSPTGSRTAARASRSTAAATAIPASPSCARSRPSSTASRRRPSSRPAIGSGSGWRMGRAIRSSARSSRRWRPPSLRHPGLDPGPMNTACANPQSPCSWVLTFVRMTFTRRYSARGRRGGRGARS